jgi:hypothetical protein
MLLLAVVQLPDMSPVGVRLDIYPGRLSKLGMKIFDEQKLTATYSLFTGTRHHEAYLGKARKTIM